MIKQLEDHYGKNVQYSLLATSRNIGVFKNQLYFSKTYNLFKIKDILTLIFSFKKYDIVIDVEEYFMISAFMSMWLGKINIGYNNIKLRGLVYVGSCKYSEKQHNLINCLNLLTKLGINIYKPEYMEKIIYKEKDKINIDNFFKQFNNQKIICLHTGGAETAPDRFRSNDNRIKLIENLIKQYGDEIIILLSGTKFEEKGVKEIIINLGQHNNIINICGMFNLFEFAYLIEKCSLMISNDTGPMHLAAAMGTKTIGLFGPNLPILFGPWPLDKNIGFYKGNGEIYIKPHQGIFKKDNENNINKITHKEIFTLINNFLGK
ncbi:MAG: glycosyltransferase family 9 protein [Candidatus Absconditicoccaceae bacterium]